MEKRFDRDFAKAVGFPKSGTLGTKVPMKREFRVDDVNLGSPTRPDDGQGSKAVRQSTLEPGP